MISKERKNRSSKNMEEQKEIQDHRKYRCYPYSKNQ